MRTAHERLVKSASHRPATFPLGRRTVDPLGYKHFVSTVDDIQLIADTDWQSA
jgi:hypothetical protein